MTKLEENKYLIERLEREKTIELRKEDKFDNLVKLDKKFMESGKIYL